MQEKSGLALTLIRLRKQKNVTAQNVADAIGIKGTTYRRYEISTEPRLEVLAKIADYFGVTTDYLIDSINGASKHEVFVCADGSEYALKTKFIALNEKEIDLINTLRGLNDSDAIDVYDFVEWKKSKG